MEKEIFAEIDSTLVDIRILNTPYVCNVEEYSCNSLCCYRACIITPEETERIERHLDGILSYLSQENRKAIEENGSFVARCERQCPGGCEIHAEEAKAVQVYFPAGSEFRCTLIHNGMCVLIYKNREGTNYCAVHSYAIDEGLKWESFKMRDCIQYPLAVIEREGKRVLTIQGTPFLNKIPCMVSKKGKPMYESLESTIEFLLGRDFAGRLKEYAKRFNKC